MPGLLGGLAAALASVLTQTSNKALITHGTSQWFYQLAAILVNLGSLFEAEFLRSGFRKRWMPLS